MSYTQNSNLVAKKRADIELMRIVAIYAVLFNHTATKGFFLFSERTDSKFYYFYLFISVACKFAVPLFYMISGGLLLKRNESILTVYKKRVFKYCLILIIISMIYWWYDCLILGVVDSLK